MNLQELRDFVRVQLDVDEEELPNSLLDAYFDEAYQRSMAMEPRWPFFEQYWTLIRAADQPGIDLPANCDAPGLMSLVDSESGVRLMQISNELAEDNFLTAKAQRPSYYTIVGMQLRLWPALTEGIERTYLLRGHRLGRDWIADGAGGEPDCDVRLHRSLAHFAIALAYANQEDEVLEDVYMKRWQAGWLAAHSAICTPRHHRPVIFNGGLPYAAGGNPVVWASPPVGP